MLSFRLFIVGTLLLFPFAVCGQSEGQIKGMVLDQGKARIARAKIYIHRKSGQQTVIADDAGEYLLNLPAGEYKVKAHSDGFHPSKIKKVRVTAKQVVELTFVLIGIRVDVKHP